MICFFSSIPKTIQKNSVFHFSQISMEPDSFSFISMITLARTPEFAMYEKPPKNPEIKLSN